MAYKVLGQSNPTVDTNTDLYTVPASTEAVASSLVVCNRGVSPLEFRVAVRPAGAAISDEHYLYYGTTLTAEATFTATLGITLEATDVVTVRTDVATASFNLFGQELAT